MQFVFLRKYAISKHLEGEESLAEAGCLLTQQKGWWKDGGTQSQLILMPANSLTKDLMPVCGTAGAVWYSRRCVVQQALCAKALGGCELCTSLSLII